MLKKAVLILLALAAFCACFGISANDPFMAFNLAFEPLERIADVGLGIVRNTLSVPSFELTESINVFRYVYDDGDGIVTEGDTYIDVGYTVGALFGRPSLLYSTNQEVVRIGSLNLFKDFWYNISMRFVDSHGEVVCWDYQADFVFVVYECTYKDYLSDLKLSASVDGWEYRP